MKNVSIFVKIMSLSVIIALLFLLIVLFWILPTIKSGLFEERLASMKAPVEMVYNYLDSIQARVETNEITKEQGIRDILRNISSLRYDGGKNYVWVNDESSVMLWHPNPKLINVNMSDRADKNGVRYVYEMTIKSKQNGEAYIEYIFPKPDNLNLHLPKISYGKFHPYWKLVVATGVWVDDVENQVSKIRNQIIIGTLIGMFLALFIAYFMSKSIVNPVIQVRDKLLNMSEGIF